MEAHLDSSGLAVTRTVAGSSQPDGCQVEAPRGAGRVRVASSVATIYGRHVRDLAEQAIRTLGCADVDIEIRDQGALPYVLMARIETAVLRFGWRPLAPLLPPAVRHSPRWPDRTGTRAYVLGSQPRLFVNVGLHRPDTVILDWEDSISSAEKDAARILVRNAVTPEGGART